MSKKLVALLLAALMILSLAACSKTETSEPVAPEKEAAAPAEADTEPAEEAAEEPAESAIVKPSKDDYVVRTVGATTLGSFLVGTPVTENNMACYGIYDTLWYVDPQTKEIKSNTLEDWHYEDDLTIVCKLKDNMYFNNGEKVTAEDALFSIVNYKERKSPVADTLGSLNVEESYCEDELTVVFKFDSPWGPGIYASPNFIYCKSWAEEVGFESEEWYNNPVGSGPYAVSEYVKDDHFTLKLREDYWNKELLDTILVDEWQFKYYGDASTMAIEFEQGKLDIVSGLTNTDRDRYLADPDCGVGVTDVVLNDMLAITFSYENNDLFQDVNLRKAICHAVDWAAIADMAYSSVAKVATSTLASTSPYYVETGTYEYDPELAAQILEENGYEPGELTFSVTAIDKPLYKNMFEGFQYYLSEVGITVNLNFLDVATAMGALFTPGNGDFCFCVSPNGSSNGEPHNVWMNYLPSGAFIGCHILDDYFQEQVAIALSTVGSDARKPIYEDLQQYMHDNYLSMPVCEYYVVYGYNPEVFTEEDIQTSVPAGQFVLLWKLSD